MTKGKQIWVSPGGKDWRAHRPGAKRAIKKTETQKEAFEVARKVALNQGAEVVIQGSNGKIREKNSYAPPEDKFPPKG